MRKNGIAHVDIINHLDMISARKVKYNTIVSKASELSMNIRNPFLIIGEEEECNRFHRRLQILLAITKVLSKFM